MNNVNPTATATDLPDAVEQMADLADICESTIYAFVSASVDKDGADLLITLARIRDLRTALGRVETILDGEAAAAMPAKTVHVQGVVMAEKRRTTDRKSWDHESWQRTARQNVLRAHGLLGATIINADGEEVAANTIAAAVSAVQAVHGSTSPRLTAMRALGMDPDEYAQTTKGRWTVDVTPLTPDHEENADE